MRCTRSHGAHAFHCLVCWPWPGERRRYLAVQMDYQDVLNAAKNLSETERGKLVRAIWPSFNKDFDLKSAIVVSFRKRERSTVRDHELIWIDLKNVSDLAIQLNSITVDTGDEFTTRFIPVSYTHLTLPTKA